ncbi:MAG: SRPBCC family protein [Myxococcales bacterium]|nr:SRPBCC family protein [Myxococcales bacterium]
MFSIPFQLSRKTTIQKDITEVFRAVGDFQSWHRWSPWFCQEPTCSITIEKTAGQVGHTQKWEGDLIGSGVITISAVQSNESLDYDLMFLKPWKSQSKVGFRFTRTSGGTVVEWWMQGSLPIFLFFMKKMMTAWVGSDYQRGLSMLKEHLETGVVPTLTKVDGVVSRPARFFIGKRRMCGLSDIGPFMEKDLGDMERLAQRINLPKPMETFSIYHRFDMVKGECEYTTGYFYDSPTEPHAGFEVGNVPAHLALRVEHQGAYRHLGNAWAAAMGCSRSKHKTNRRVPMYELYLNSPKDAAEKDLRVDIYVPVKR